METRRPTGAVKVKIGITKPGADQDQDITFSDLVLKKMSRKDENPPLPQGPSVEVYSSHPVGPEIEVEDSSQTLEETQSSPALTTNIVEISEGTVARARERIQQQAHSSSPSLSGTTRSRMSQATLGQVAQSQSLLPGMSQYASLYVPGQVAQSLQQLQQQRQSSTRS